MICMWIRIALTEKLWTTSRFLANFGEITHAFLKDNCKVSFTIPMTKMNKHWEYDFWSQSSRPGSIGLASNWSQKTTMSVISSPALMKFITSLCPMENHYVQQGTGDHVQNGPFSIVNCGKNDPPGNPSTGPAASCLTHSWGPPSIAAASEDESRPSLDAVSLCWIQYLLDFFL